MATKGDYIGRAVNDILVRGLRPFVEQRIASNSELHKLVREHVLWQRSEPSIVLDAQALLRVMDRCWFDYFHGSFTRRPRAVRSYVNELRDARDRYAHATTDDVLSNVEVDHILGSAQLLLTAIGAESEAVEVEDLRRQFHGECGRDQAGRTGRTGGPLESRGKTTRLSVAVASKLWSLRSYTAPDGTIVIPFIDHNLERDYLDWTRNHVAGFVVNAPRSSPSGMKLHRAWCGTINGADRNLIGDSYFKVCSEDKEALLQWVDDQMKPWSTCGTCKP